ncbi:hypothetical protein GQ44DRAFT_667864 [Phaeosphaeriaceae sp. PMI808]|nr:hypothetical protein GQ44DRAFT_667864 [Phaeosphaeriaceae sp. PMI808]
MKGNLTDHEQDYSLLKLDMSHSWEYHSKEPSLELISSPHASNGPPLSLIYSSILQGSNGSFYIYGGGVAMSNATSKRPMTALPVQNKLWSLSNNSSSWLAVAIGMSEGEYAPMHGLSVQAPEHDLAFYLNGIVRNGSIEQAYPRMIIIDMRTKEFRTEPLDSISVFDVASLDTTPDGLWYRQRTIGRTPGSRLTTCAISIPSPDFTSYHIYMFSGRSSSESYDDVWVLSLPQFRWTQVFAGVRWNHGSTCHLAGNKQLIALGGTTETAKSCMYVALFDLTNLKWLRRFVVDDVPFRVPKAVWEWIGGSGMGEAKVREPEGGFSSPGLAILFERMNARFHEKSGAVRKEVGRGWGCIIVVLVMIWIVEL